MRDNSINIQQDVLITRFNQFAKLAKEYLGIDIAELNERGCCYALSLYNIKHASEGTIDQFYHYILTISNQFTDESIPALLQRAQITSDQKILHQMTHGGSSSAKYNDFQFKTDHGPMRFSDLMDFVQGVSKAQVGYTSKMAKGRFVERYAQYHMGRLESVKGNWENSYVISGTKDTLIDSLRQAHLTDHHYALIQSGNHAINFRRTDDNRFLVYDSNDQSFSKKCDTLEEVAKTIVENFERVGNCSETGHVTMSIDTASIESGDNELKKTIQEYRRSLMQRKPIEGVALECHDGVIDYLRGHSSLMTLAGEITALCSQLKEEGKVQNTREFIKMIPGSLQLVVLESLNYLKRADFVRLVEGKAGLHYDATQVTPQQKATLDKINEYFAQYNEGFLSRTDFANNVVRLIQTIEKNPGDTSEYSHFQTQSVYSELLQLEQALNDYLDNTVTASDLLHNTEHIDLNTRDNTGYTLFHMACEASPNMTTLKALLDQDDINVLANISIENPRDYLALKVLLSFGNSEVAEYIMTKIDINKALSANNFSLMKDILESRNIEVCKVLLHSLIKSSDTTQFDINQKIAGKSVLQHALKMDSPSLVISALEHKAKLSTLTYMEMDELLSKSSTRNLEKDYQRITDRQDYTYEHFKSDFAKEFSQKEYKESDIAAEWAKVQEKEQALMDTKGKASLKEYSFEQFQQENADRFKTVEQWAGVVEHIIQLDNKENHERLFDALIRNERLELAVRVFLKESIDSPQWKVKQQQLFYAAVKAGDSGLVERLIAQQEQIDPSQVNALVNSKVTGGLSMLAEACKRGHNKVADKLLDYGAEVKEDKASPLSFAARFCKMEVCERLSQKRASIFDRSSIDNSTPLVGVMLSGMPKEEKIKKIRVLLRAESEGKIDPKTIEKNLIHEAIIEAAKDPKTTFADIELFVNTFGVKLSEVRSQKRETPAMLALDKGNLKLFNKIINNTGLDLDHNSKLLKIALNSIREQERLKNGGKGNYQQDQHEALIEQVKSWINNNPQLVNKPFDDGTTPLMRAAEAGNSFIAELLLQKGADVHAIKVIPLAHNPNEPTTPEKCVIHFALRSENPEMIRLIVGEGIDLKATDADGYTPMQRLVAKYRPTLAEVIELKGREQGLNALDDKGNTLLHLAVSRSGSDKSLGLIQDLMKEGLDPCQKNTEGKSPIMIALSDDFKNYPVVVAMLENMSSKELSKNKELRDALKPHKDEILKCYKESFKNTDLNNSESKAASCQRLEAMTQLKNGMGHLYRTKIKLTKNNETTLGKILPRFHLANEVMKELKAFKQAFLEENKPKKATKREQTRQWKNL